MNVEQCRKVIRQRIQQHKNDAVVMEEGHKTHADLVNVVKKELIAQDLLKNIRSVKKTRHGDLLLLKVTQIMVQIWQKR